jgi:hypothetical protein
VDFSRDAVAKAYQKAVRVEREQLSRLGGVYPCRSPIQRTPPTWAGSGRTTVVAPC